MDDAVTPFSPRKLAGLAAVLLLHAALLLALLDGLGVPTAQIFEHPLEVKIIQPPKPPRLAPPPPPQMVAPPPPFIPPPLVQVAPPPVVAVVTHVRPAAPPVPRPVPEPVARPAPAPVPPPPKPIPAAPRAAAMLDPGQSCAPPQYPQDAEDMEQTGTSILQFLISADGGVLRSRVASSSGHASLDAAAEQALGQCRFRPAIGEDGKPQEAWTSIRYVWRLN